MRPGVAHRHNTAFARSSSLGEVHAKPVIQEVTVRRGNGAKRTIVKDGTIYEQKFGYRKYDKITFEATLIGSGYFYATVMYEGENRLIFATRANHRVTYTIEQEIPLVGLNFHIAPTVPSNLDPSWMDPKSRELLKMNPASYSKLGFIPVEPQRTSSGNNWDGKIDNHKWSYGRSGTDVSRGESVKLWQNYDAGWLGASALYQYIEGQGWECVQQNIANMQVGRPLCIVGQMYGYRDTYGYGGEYWQYRNKGGDMLWGSKADYFGGRNIRLMEHGARNEQAGKGRNYGKNVYSIQSSGGQHKTSYNGSYHWNRGDEMDKYCAKVEWWNPETNTWSEPRVYPDYSSPISKRGRFVFYFRFPRQLTKEDEFYEKTPQWQIEKTWDCYPRWDDRYKETAPDYGAVYSRIGRPNVKGSNEGIEIEFQGRKLRTSRESPPYCIMIAPEATSDDGNSDYQKDRFICTSGNVVYYAVDPHAYSYSDNPDITNAYWVNGNFKPGGAFMLLGMGVDFFPGFWVSTSSLAKKNNTPMDLRNTQRDLVRGSHAPNEFTADKITEGKMRKFKLTDVNDPVKVEKFLPSWEACFPGVPLTKEILVALLRGDQLPQLEEVENTKISGFLEDDPLRYEVEVQGSKFRHSWSLVYCEIPEGWWGPTIDESDKVTSVFIGGQNHYYFIKEEKVDLRKEIEAQKAKEAAGLTAVEAFADSELENPMVDITFEAYKNRNEVISESVNEAAQDDRSWFFRTEQVKFKHKRFSLLGSVGEVTDVTDKYSADQVTSLDGISAKNVDQYHFNDLYLVQGIGNSPSIVLTPPKEPSGGTPLIKSNVSGFGNSDRNALKSRALGHGNPMKYSTEDQQLGSIQTAQLGTVLDDLLEVSSGTIASTTKTIGYALLGIGVVTAVVKAGPLINDFITSGARKREAKNRALAAEADAIVAVRRASKGA